MEMEMLELYGDIFSENDFAVIKKAAETMKEFMKLEMNGEVKDLQGYKSMPGFSPEVAEYAYNNSQPKTGDVYLVSYPKTGTNWTMEVLQQILFEDEQEKKLYNGLPILFKVLEMLPCEKFELLDKLPLKRRLIGSHLPSPLINLEKIKQVDAKVVYVLRNPKDQLVSWYKFSQVIPQSQIEPIKSMVHSGWDHFFNHAVEGAFPMFSKPGEWYPEHILSWYQHLDNKQVTFVFFEDMKKDLVGQVKALAQFLEVSITEERAKKIAESCTFDNMKKTRAENEAPEAQMLQKIMRKGGVGGWKDYFTVSQSERVDAIIQEKLKGTNIKFTYQLE